MSSSSKDGRLTVPSDTSLTLQTQHLVLEPILKTHALEMSEVLSSPELYRFIPQDPPLLQDLEVRYEKWETRCSPDQSELWLNWIARRKSDDKLVGHIQAGLTSQRMASIAYTVGKPFQRQGYAAESLQAALTWMGTVLKPECIQAWVDTRNEASIGLLKKLGFEQTSFLPKADFFRECSSDEFIFTRRKDG